jgi:hypothetical protein
MSTSASSDIPDSWRALLKRALRAGVILKRNYCDSRIASETTYYSLVRRGVKDLPYLGSVVCARTYDRPLWSSSAAIVEERWTVTFNYTPMAAPGALDLLVVDVLHPTPARVCAGAYLVGLADMLVVRDDDQERR